MGKIIKGKPVADEITTKLVSEVEGLKAQGIIPKLVIVRVGQNTDDISYEKGAVKRCSRIGIEVEVKNFTGEITQEEFIAEIEKMNCDSTINGIIILRPPPPQIDEGKIKYIIEPLKDVDCFNPANMSKILEGEPSGFSPCTASAVMEILRYYKVQISGKRAVVIGRSMVVGKPLSMLLLNCNATVTICHSKTENIGSVCSEADIVVACVGKAEMVDSNYIKEGAVVIDVGINVDHDGKLCGDIDTENCIEKSGMITPVPGGVGAVTTSILAKHVVRACRLQHEI